MATRTWTGAVSGDWSNASNWSPTNVPVAGDDVYITSGSQNIYAGLDQSAVDLATLYIGYSTAGPTGYTGTIGNSNADPLKVGAAKVVVNGGGGTHYLSPGGTYNFDMFYMISTGITGSGTMNLTGPVGSLIHTGGNIYLYSGTTTTYEFTPNSPTHKLDVLNATITTLNQTGGIVTLLNTGSSATITTANVHAGSMLVHTGTLTTLNLWSGNCTWKTSTTMTNASLRRGGILSASGLSAQTITNLYLYPGGKAVISEAGVGAKTITNRFDYGGELAAALT